MGKRGYGSPYLWAWRKAEQERDTLIEQETIDLLKNIAKYEKQVCAYCPQVFCEVEKTELCYKNFIEKEIE